MEQCPTFLAEDKFHQLMQQPYAKSLRGLTFLPRRTFITCRFNVIGHSSFCSKHNPRILKIIRKQLIF